MGLCSPGAGVLTTVVAGGIINTAAGLAPSPLTGPGTPAAAAATPPAGSGPLALSAVVRFWMRVSIALILSASLASRTLRRSRYRACRRRRLSTLCVRAGGTGVSRA